MRKTLIASLCLLALTSSLPAADQPAAAGDPNAPLWRAGYPAVSPFQAVRYPTPTSIDVQVNGTWYHLRALHTHPTADVIERCQSLDKDNWQKRFEQDLIEVLARTKSPLPHPDRVDLKVQPTTGGEEQTLKDTPMTPENRRALWHARQSTKRN